MGYPKGLSQDPNCNKNCKECDCCSEKESQKCCCEQEGKSCGQKSNFPPAKCPCDQAAAVGFNDQIEINLKWTEGITAYNAKASGFDIDLKSGGKQSFDWNFRPMLNPDLLAVDGTDWLPAGRGASFSNFPYLTLASSTEYRRLNEKGMVEYTKIRTSGNKTFYAPKNSLPYIAWYDSTTKEFVEYDPDEEAHYTYGGESHNLQGRPIKKEDRNGNVTHYHYDDNSSGQPLLRKMTGNLKGVTAYFEYDDGSYPAVISEMKFVNDDDPSDSRSVSYDYQSTTQEDDALLEKVTYPEGVEVKYNLEATPANPVHEQILSQQDPEGWLTSFEYDGTALGKTVEPEEKVTYFDYNFLETKVRPQGRPTTEYKYELTGATENLQVTSKKDPLDNLTYYQWAESTFSSLGPNAATGKMEREIKPNGLENSYQYNGQGIEYREDKGGQVTEHSYGKFAKDSLEDYRNDLVSVWKFDEPIVDTNVAYDSKNANNGIIFSPFGTSDVTYDVTGKDGKALEFGGSLSYMLCGADNSLQAQNSYTISAWVKPDSASVDQTITGRQGYYPHTRLMIKSNGKFAFEVYQNNQASSPKDVIEGGTVSTGNWSHVVAVKDGSNMYLYVDGTQVASTTTTYSPPKGSWTIAGSFDQFLLPIDPYDGVIDEVYLWDTALSSTDISTLYNSGTGEFYERNLISPFMKTDARGNISYFEYDNNQNRTAMIDPLGNRFETDWDSAGRVIRETDPDNHSTYYNYDEDTGNQISEIDPLDNVTYYQYSVWGEKIAETSPRWKETDNLSDFTRYYQYDGLKRQIKSTDPLGNTTYYQHNKRSEKIKESDPLGLVTYWQYNGLQLNTKQEKLDPQGNTLQTTEFEYDRHKNRIKHTNSRGFSELFAYDFNERISRKIDPLQARMHHEYDSVGNVINTKLEREIGKFANSTIDAYADHLVSLWQLEESPPEQIIDGAGISDGMAYGGVSSSSSGKNGKCLNFSGNNGSYVELETPEDLRFSDSFTISAWINTDDADTEQLIVGRIDTQEPALALKTKSNGKFSFQVFSGAASDEATGGTVSTGTWFHVVAVKDNNNLTLYVNGSSVDTTTTSYVPTSKGFFRIGGHSVSAGSPTDWFDGKIDEVYIWNTALSSSAISDLYNSGTGRFFTRESLEQRSSTEYDVHSRPIAQTDALGNTTYFAYDKMNNQTTTIDPLGRVTYYDYDPRNLLIQEQDALDNITTYEYDNTSNQTAQVDARNNVTYFFYDALDRQKGIIDALGNETYYEFDAASNQTAQIDARTNTAYFYYDQLNRQQGTIDALGNETYYQFDAVGNQIKEVDARTNTTYFYYDALYRQQGTIDALGNETYFTFDQVGNQTSQVDARGNTTYFYYDPKDRQKGMIDALGNETYYTFDALDNRTSEVDARNNPTYFYYDQLNRQKGTIDALGNETYFTYDQVGNQIEQVDACNNTTYFYYDELNRQKGIIDALGNETYFTYDQVGNQIEQVDARNNTTYFYYDALNRQKGNLDALGNETYFEFDQVGNQIKQVDARTNTTYFYYDSLNRQKGTIDALGNETYFTYDEVGNQTAQTNALSHTTYFYFDQLNRQKGTIDPLGNETYFTYDSLGNQTSQIDALGQTTYFYFDNLNRQKGTIDALGNETYFEFDQTGNRVTTVDPLGLTNYFQYDPLNRLESTQDPIGAVTTFGYDEVSNLTSIGDAKSNTTYYSYDALQRLTSIDNPLKQIEYYSYDPNSNLASSQDPDGNVIYFGYDQLNRQTSIDYPDNELSYYQYDQVSNLTQMTDSHGNTYFTYDNLNRLTQETQPSGQNITYTYDAIGQRSTLATESQACYYSYDPANRLTKIAKETQQAQGYGEQSWGSSSYGGESASTPTTYYHYNNNSLQSKKVLANGVFTYYTYDEANRVTQILNCKPDGSPLAYFEYDYDPASRITKIQRENGDVIYYGYDDASRLTSETWYDSGMTEIYAFEWDYDLVGNRTYQREGTAETYYSYDSGNALISKVTGGEYSYFAYDSRGNCTQIQESDGTIYFEYNHANLVTNIKYKDGIENKFHYDAMLRRYAWEDSDGLRYFSWDSNGLNLLEERNSSGEVTAQYTHGYAPIEGIGSLVQGKHTVSETTYFQYPLYDHRGTVYQLTDENGEVVADYQYNAWGQVLEESEGVGGSLNRFRYQSNWLELKDSQGRFVLSPARVYSSDEGRFLQRDPLGINALRQKIGFYNTSIFGTAISYEKSTRFKMAKLYHFVSNLPSKWIDVLGLFEFRVKDFQENGFFIKDIVAIVESGDTPNSLSKALGASVTSEVGDKTFVELGIPIGREIPLRKVAGGRFLSDKVKAVLDRATEVMNARKKIIRELISSGAKIHERATTSFSVVFYKMEKGQKFFRVKSVPPGALKIQDGKALSNDPNCFAFVEEFIKICRKCPFKATDQFIKDIMKRSRYRKIQTQEMKLEDILFFSPRDENDSGHAAVVFAIDKGVVWVMDRQFTGGPITIKTLSEAKNINEGRRPIKIYREK